MRHRRSSRRPEARILFWQFVDSHDLQLRSWFQHKRIAILIWTVGQTLIGPRRCPESSSAWQTILVDLVAGLDVHTNYLATTVTNKKIWPSMTKGDERCGANSFVLHKMFELEVSPDFKLTSPLAPALTTIMPAPSRP